jgi:hypothetical protein
MKTMPTSMPIDLASVDWLYVVVLAVSGHPGRVTPCRYPGRPGKAAQPGHGHHASREPTALG